MFFARFWNFDFKARERKKKKGKQAYDFSTRSKKDVPVHEYSRRE